MRKIITLNCLATAIFLLMFFAPKPCVEGRGTVVTDTREAKCAMMSLTDSRKFSAAIFVGAVIGVREEGDRKIFHFRVEKYWKGNPRIDDVEVYVFQTIRYPASYQLDKKYLVYAQKDDDGNLHDQRCSRSNDYLNPTGIADRHQLGKPLDRRTCVKPPFKPRVQS